MRRWRAPRCRTRNVRDRREEVRDNALVRYPAPPAHWTLCFGTRERPVAWRCDDFIVVCPTHQASCRLLERAPGELSVVAFGFAREFCFALAHQLMAQRKAQTAASAAASAAKKDTRDW